MNRYKKDLCHYDRTVFSPAVLFGYEYEGYLLCSSANIVDVNIYECISYGLAVFILSGIMFSVLTGEPSKRGPLTFASSFFYPFASHEQKRASEC